MEIREMPLEQLHTADYNPRVALEPGAPEFERLKNSIETFGEVAPIVWNQRRPHRRRPSKAVRL